MSGDVPHVVVVGGGVAGLSAAISLLDHPSHPPCYVTLIAKDLPSLDPAKFRDAPASYASAWAGAHHISDAKTERELNIDKVTFKVFQKMENWHMRNDRRDKGEEGKMPFIWVHQVEYWADGVEADKDVIRWYPDYNELPVSALPSGTAFGCTLSSYDIIVPLYMPYLYRLYLSLGGRALQAQVTSSNQALSLAQSPTAPFVADLSSSSFWSSRPPRPSTLVLAPGLGALSLADDEAVYPVRGQTILVRAPWCTTTASQEPWAFAGATGSKPLHKWPGMSRSNKGGFRDMYILARGDGTFIVGGTRLPNDWDDRPREETTKEIIERALRFMPTLANPDRCAPETDPHISDVDIVAVNVGLRPVRRGGARVERGYPVDGVAVVYSYGYGGHGYQASWGAAFEVRGLVDDALNRSRAPVGSTLASLDKDDTLKNRPHL